MRENLGRKQGMEQGYQGLDGGALVSHGRIWVFEDGVLC